MGSIIVVDVCTTNVYVLHVIDVLRSMILLFFFFFVLDE